MDKALESMKRLMDFSVYTAENNDKRNTSSIVEYKKIGGDGKCYGIVREDKKYYIKVSDKTVDVLKEDFNYIGGISEKARYAYPGYQDALKSIELKLRSINESRDKSQPDTSKPSTFMTEETMDMNKEINRVRQIMFGSSQLIREANEFKPVLDIKATDADKKAEPFTIKATVPAMDKIPTSKKNVDPVKAGVPFCDEVQADMKADPSKAAKKFKITGLQLEAVRKALKEDYGQPDYDLMAGDDDLGGKGWDLDEEEIQRSPYPEDREFDSDSQSNDMIPYSDEMDNEPFKAQGSYTVSNSGGYLIQISDDGDSARVKDAFGGDEPQISDWLEIEYVEDEDGGADEDGLPELVPVIDPNGYNIPLNQVMRINNEEVTESYGQPDYDLIGGDDDLGSRGWGLDDDETLEEGLWDNIKAMGSVGKWAGDKAKQGAQQTGQAVANKVGQQYNKASQAVSDTYNNVKTGVSQQYNKSQQNSSADKIQQIATSLKAEIDNLNARTVKAGGQPLNMNSVIATLSNQLRGNKGVNTSKYKNEEKTYEIDEENLVETILNVFGKVDSFGKQPFTVPGGANGKTPGTTAPKADGTEVEAKFPEDDNSELKPVDSIEKTNLYMEKLSESILKELKKGKLDEISGALANRASDVAYERGNELGNRGDSVGANIKDRQGDKFGRYVNPELKKYAESNGLNIISQGDVTFISLTSVNGGEVKLRINDNGSYDFVNGALSGIPTEKQRVVSNIIKKIKQDANATKPGVAESKQVKKKV